MEILIAALKGTLKGILQFCILVYLSVQVYYYSLPLEEQRQYDMTYSFELFDFMNYKLGETESITVVSFFRGWVSSYCYIGIVDGRYQSTSSPDLERFGDRDAMARLKNQPMISFPFDTVVWVEVMGKKAIIHSSGPPVIHDHLSSKYIVEITDFAGVERNDPRIIGCPEPKLHPHSMLQPKI